MADGEATIAFLDLTRFTTLTDVHGDAAAVDLLDRFLACVHDALEDDATVVKTLGDGVLLRADTATAGIGVAARVVERFHDEPGLPDLAGGLHHGPVVDRSGDVVGATVNLAARLSDAASPGELYITRGVAQAAGDHGFTVRALGPLELRGVVEPVEVFAVSPCEHQHHRTATDPVCGMRIVPTDDTPHLEADGQQWWFCAPLCAATFAADPGRFVLR